MRKITKIAHDRFLLGQPFHKQNTSVVVRGMLVDLVLHGHVIATRSLLNTTGAVHFSLCGWPSVTTRERLQAAGVSIAQRKGKQYFIHPYTKEETEINPDKIYGMDDTGNLYNINNGE